jgi:hypothetical protein
VGVAVGVAKGVGVAVGVGRGVGVAATGSGVPTGMAFGITEFGDPSAGSAWATGTGVFTGMAAITAG